MKYNLNINQHNIKPHLDIEFKTDKVKQHKHKRMKGWCICKCGKYLGTPRKWVTLQWIKGDNL